MATSIPTDEEKNAESKVLFLICLFFHGSFFLLLLIKHSCCYFDFGRFLSVPFNMHVLLGNVVCRTNYVKFIDRFGILQWKKSAAKWLRKINTHQHKRKHPMLLYKRGYFSKDSIFRWKCICIDLLLLRCLLLCVSVLVWFFVWFLLSSCFKFSLVLFFSQLWRAVCLAILRLDPMVCEQLCAWSPTLLMFDYCSSLRNERANETYFIFMQIVLFRVLFTALHWTTVLERCLLQLHVYWSVEHSIFFFILFVFLLLLFLL